MSITGNWIFTASMDVDPDKEALFNEVYDTEHVPYLRKVPGVVSATRCKLGTLRITMGGETKTVDSTGVPRYACMLELENPASNCRAIGCFNPISRKPSPEQKSSWLQSRRKHSVKSRARSLIFPAQSSASPKASNIKRG